MSKKPINTFTPVELNVNFPELEEKILAYWKKHKSFEKSVENRPEDKTWTFLDGPPFITGMPHYGSLLSSLPKDLFPRFWTMKGYRVRRVWGWDCHGLPAENKVEQKLGIERKRDIEEKIGVKKFIDECKLYVSEVSSEWEWYVDHIARWVDFKNAYKTMDQDYMESVMWVFKQMYEKEYIYKGLRVSLYCPHCSTPISNFEVAMDVDNYKEITEPANTYKYKLRDEDNTFLLAWSTTPWNKIATPALAINPNISYVKVKQGKEFYVLAKTRLEMLIIEPYEIIEEFNGERLLDREFEPHYDFYKVENGKRAHVIIPGEFVSSDEGTGIVTIAAYGEDDLAAMKENNIQIVLHVDDEGHLKKDVPNWGGMYYLKVNKLVNEDLEKRGLLYREDEHHHTVPTCWRCHTRLYYAPQDAWFVDIARLKPKLAQNNKHVHWYPKHFKDGRFLKSLEAAPDWCISRSRYWGSPVPVWETPSGERFVPGSIAELEQLSGQKVVGLHKPEIDEITIKSPKTGEIAHRVPEVLDSWSEAGSAAFAERHYPFEAKGSLEQFFPPDFISEYTGQIRAWFYVLHVFATALELRESKENILARNVLVTGVIKGTDGRKMSKNFGNYPDPKEMLQKYGGDALRLYLLGSPVMHAEDILISEEEYKNQVRGFLLPLWNVYNFFVTYANVDGWKPSKAPIAPKHVLDRWILSRLNVFLREVTEKGYEAYNTPAIVSLARDFLVNDLSGWYVRRSRGRFGPNSSEVHKEDGYQTLYRILIEFTKAVAPLAPFVSEEIYKNLTSEASVHLADWPVVQSELIDQKVEEEMNLARKIVEMGHSQRKEKNIAVRQPLNKLTSSGPGKLSDDVSRIIQDELNVLEHNHHVKDEYSVVLDTELTERLKALGIARGITRQIQQERKAMGTKLHEKVDVRTPQQLSEEAREYIRSKAMVRNLTEGGFRVKRIDE